MPTLVRTLQLYFLTQVHCCPPGFGDEWPLLPLNGISPQLRSVSGDPITVYGKRIVGLELDGHTCYLHFYVCDVYLPVVSVSRLITQGYITYLSTTKMTLTATTGQTVTVHCTGPMFYLQPKILPYNDSDFDSICTNMRLQLATVTSTFQFTLVAGATSKETSTKKTVFYHADRWKQEGNLLIRLHKRPRKALLNPVGTKDLPVDSEELVGLENN